jgi:hypothetical protein
MRVGDMRIGNYFISDWMESSSKDLSIYRLVSYVSFRAPTHISIYDRGAIDKWTISFNDIDFINLYEQMFPLSKHYGFNSIYDARDRVDLFLDKFSKLKAFL